MRVYEIDLWRKSRQFTFQIVTGGDNDKTTIRDLLFLKIEDFEGDQDDYDVVISGGEGDGADLERFDVDIAFGFGANPMQRTVAISAFCRFVTKHGFSCFFRNLGPCFVFP